MLTREQRSLVPPPTLPDFGRTGRKGTAHSGLPPQVTLPALTSALSRRAALFGAVTVASVTAASTASTAIAAALSANDARLVALADAYEALDRRCNEHTAAHRHLGFDARKIADVEFNRIVDGFGPLEEECADTPADSFVGVMAKARLCQSPTAHGCADYDHIASVADDLWRLFGKGALS